MTFTTDAPAAVFTTLFNAVFTGLGRTAALQHGAH